jgi:hypothetical protein
MVHSMYTYMVDFTFYHIVRVTYRYTSNNTQGFSLTSFVCHIK